MTLAIDKKLEKEQKKNYTVPKEWKDKYNFYTQRKEQLISNRQNIHGTDLDKRIINAEKSYLPHKASVSSPRTIDNAQLIAFSKINTALSLMINDEFDADFSPSKDKYRKTSELMKSLVFYSLDPQVSASRSQYINAAHNFLLFGWAGMKTYRKMIRRNDVVEYDEVSCRTLHNADFWIDDQALPGDRWSINDWVERKVYGWHDFLQEFPKDAFPDVVYVQKSGDVQLHLDSTNTSDKTGNSRSSTGSSQDKVEVFFYENLQEDLYLIEANNVCFHFGKLPLRKKRRDGTEVSRLSLSYNHLWLRSTDTAYGLGFFDIIEQDERLINMIIDMSVEQLQYSILSVIFHEGVSKIEGGDDFVIKPGLVKKLRGVDKMKQFRFDPPGRENVEFYQLFEKNLDEKLGINKVLEGQSLGKTAFEANLVKESSMSRLSLPVENLKALFEWEMYNRTVMIQQIYSLPKIEKLTSEEEIKEYVKEVGGEDVEFAEDGTPSKPIDEDLYAFDQEGNFHKKEYRSLPLKLEKDEKGEFMNTEDTKFTTIKPEYLDWEGKISIKVKSLLVSSKVLEKAATNEFVGRIIEIMNMIVTNPTVATDMIPLLKQLCLKNNEAPEDWIPKRFLVAYDEQQKKLEMEEEQKEKMEEMKKSMPQEVPQNPTPQETPVGMNPETEQTEGEQAQTSPEVQGMTEEMNSAMQQQ